MAFKEMADEFFIKCKMLTEQKDELSDSYLVLQEERIVLQEKLRVECKKEWEGATEELTKHYEQSIQLVTAEAKSNQATYELLATRLQAEVNGLKEELAVVRAQPGMDETRIRILIDKQRQHLTKKVEETLGRAGEEWAVEAAELHILRAEPRTDGRRVEAFTKWTKPAFKTSVQI